MADTTLLLRLSLLLLLSPSTFCLFECTAFALDADATNLCIIRFWIKVVLLGQCLPQMLPKPIAYTIPAHDCYQIRVYYQSLNISLRLCRPASIAS